MNAAYEEWTVIEPHLGCARVKTPGSRIAFDFNHVSECQADHERAKLVAAAPDMARALLRLIEPAFPPTIRDDDGYIAEIEAALKKAGVRP